MLIAKVEQRIRQYIAFLDRNKWERIGSPAFEVIEGGEGDRTPPVREGWSPIRFPYPYGKEWTYFWFRTSFALPGSAEGKEVYLRAAPNADTLVFIDGTPAAALNPFHTEVRLADAGEPERRYLVHFESYAGHRYPGMHPLQPPAIILTLGRHIADYPNSFDFAELAVKRPNVYPLSYDALVLFEVAMQLDANSLRRNRILRDLYNALTLIRFEAGEEELVEQAGAARQAVESLLAARNGDTTPSVHLVGHAHIDHAWLWPLRETERKAGRTFANMTRLAEEFPEFVFVQSQPAQLAMVRKRYPAVFERVKSAFDHGQWEPNGGMWVEADCNLSGGESLVRQFLVGKQATREMLGYEGDTLWLPDVFGYAAALPQILAGCEIEYFVTSKINWNDTTRFPYDTFLWKGIDGSVVKTHYITSRMDGYNGRVRPAQLVDAWNQVQHKEVQEGVLKSIGEGDGGGGTTRDDLEMARRLANLEGAPKASWSKVSDALRRIFAGARELPVWEGELYLELHRGTYTTQARTKRYNRKLEFSLRECEFLYSILSALDPTESKEQAGSYPRAELLECWKRLLTNQFHDIIPGSSIRQVYEDAEASYREVEAVTGRLIEQGKRLLAVRLQGKRPPASNEAAVTLFNSLSWERNSRVDLPLAQAPAAPLTLAAGEENFPVQVSIGPSDEPRATAFPRLPSMGMRSFAVREGKAAESSFKLEGNHLTTPFYRIEFDGSRALLHLVERASGRDYVAPGEKFNLFQSAEDLPVLWDAWDIDVDWERSLVREERLESTQVLSDGPLFLQMRNRFRIGERSSLVQDLFFYSRERRIDFVTRVEWREAHRLLKVAFPVGISTNRARCEVQYGHVLRETHMNLPQDRARFEVCGHKWICVEEAGFGVALLNDCKYGHDIRGSAMRLTLLRSPKAPDPEADMGSHEFTYSLLPMAAPFSVEEVVRSAYELNRPAGVLDSAPAGGQERSFFEVDDPNVIIEAVKLAEPEQPPAASSGRPAGAKGGASLILRLYEAGGGSRKVRLRTSLPLLAAWETNLLERNPKVVSIGAASIPLEFHPFEIKTVKLEIGRN